MMSCSNLTFREENSEKQRDGPLFSVIFAMTSSENMVKTNTFYVAPADFGACSQASKPVQEIGLGEPQGP
jgi:hypothetical protein